MRLRSLGYTTDLALLELGGTTVADLRDCYVVRSAHNPTHWWGNFLIAKDVPPPGDAAAWVERFGAEFPDAKHLALGFDAVQGTTADLSGFSALGLNAEAQAVTTATEVHAPRTQNREAICRALSTDEDWSQSVALRLECIDEDLDPVPYREFATRRAATNRQLVERGHGGWFGAFVDGRLACQMGLFPAGVGLARFQSVETSPQFRRMGLAGTLVHHVSRFGFDELGASTLVMVADPNYWAIELYRSVGFEVTETQLQVERRPTSG